jgi:hypothetical protein
MSMTGKNKEKRGKKKGEKDTVKLTLLRVIDTCFIIFVRMVLPICVWQMIHLVVVSLLSFYKI